MSLMDLLRRKHAGPTDEEIAASATAKRERAALIEESRTDGRESGAKIRAAMLPFDPLRKCTKCGAGLQARRFIRADFGEFPAMLPTDRAYFAARQAALGDCLRVTCRACGFAWDALPLDAAPPPAPGERR